MKHKVIFPLLLTVILTGCEDLFIPPAEQDLNLEDFEACWERVDAVYPYLSYKHINWDSIHNVYRPQAEQARGDEIYPVLINMLAELKDMHAHVRTEGGEYIQTYSPPRWLKDREAFDPLVVQGYFDRELTITGEGHISYGILEGNIGYVYLGTFDADYLSNFFPEALEYVQNTRALILDIRHNNGGTYQNLVAAVSRFIDAPLAKPAYYILGEFIPLDPFIPEGKFQYLNPVVLLINGVCYSCADIFPEVMKQIPTVTLVGDTTSGGSSGSDRAAPALYTLPSGKKIYVGTTDWRAYDGTPLEWKGCAPDILVEQTKADILAGRDLQLEYAINLLK